jgi:peptidyl-Lys metalloendopeptidase
MKLSTVNFIDRTEENNHKKMVAEVYPLDCMYRIFLTDLFWKSKPTGRNSKAGIVIHELSHFENIGDTKDFVYKNLALEFAKSCPNDALNKHPWDYSYSR